MGMLEGKVGLVTGAGSGIGRAVAVAMAREGAKVVVADIDAKGGAESVAEIEGVGGEAFFVSADVSDPAAMEAAVKAGVDHFGSGKQKPICISISNRRPHARRWSAQRSSP